jgi:WD40 repeat protein
MTLNSYCRAQVTIIAVALLCACSPAVAPAGSAPVPTLIPTTPAPVVISRSTAQDVVLLRTFEGHTGRVLDVAFSAQGRYLASSSQDMSIKVWDVSSGQEVHAFRMTSVDMSDIDISTDGSRLASAEAIWDLDSMEEIRALERGSRLPASVAFSPDGSALALGLFDQQITLWDVGSGQRVRTLEKREENRTKRMDFTPDGALLAAGVIDGSIRLFDVASGEIANVLQYAGETDIHDLAFSPGGEYLASCGRVTAVILWDVAKREVVRRFGLADNCMSAAFSPDGTVLAASAGGSWHDVRLWETESGTVLHVLKHNGQVTRVTFSPDGTLLASACLDHQIYVWGIPANPEKE